MPFPEESVQAAGVSPLSLPFALNSREGSCKTQSRGTQWDPPGSGQQPTPWSHSLPEPGERERQHRSGHQDADDPRAGAMDGNRSG